MITRPKLAIVDNFSIIPNDWVRDTRLSRKARGLLAELMSHRPGWEVSLQSLADGGPEGIDAIRAGIKELVEAGYLRVQRSRDESGKLRGMDYILQDPAEMGVSPTPDNPTLGKPTLADPMTKKTISSEDNLEEDQAGLFQPPQPALGAPSRKTKRATSFPADFEVTGEMADWARKETPLVAVHPETKKFEDHHRAKGTTFKDWHAAWRNWMRNAQGYINRDRAAAGRPQYGPQQAQQQPAYAGSRVGIDYESELGDWA